MQCAQGHTISLNATYCRECNRLAVQRYRAKKQRTLEPTQHASGPLWQLLRALGYVGKRKTKADSQPNSLGLEYKGP